MGILNTGLFNSDFLQRTSVDLYQRSPFIRNLLEESTRVTDPISLEAYDAAAFIAKRIIPSEGRNRLGLPTREAFEPYRSLLPSGPELKDIGRTYFKEGPIPAFKRLMSQVDSKMSPAPLTTSALNPEFTWLPATGLSEQHAAFASVGGKDIGHLYIDKASGEIAHINVNSEFQRQGVGAGLLGFARAQGIDVKHSSDRTDLGEAFARADARHTGAFVPSRISGASEAQQEARDLLGTLDAFVKPSMSQGLATSQWSLSAHIARRQGEGGLQEAAKITSNVLNETENFRKVATGRRTSEVLGALVFGGRHTQVSRMRQRIARVASRDIL